MKSRISQLLPFLIVGGITVVLFFVPLFGPKKATSINAKVKAPAAVVTVPVTREDLREVYLTVGTAAGRSEVKLTSQIEGLLQAVEVKVGDRVKKGQTLAILDDRLLRADLAQTEAALKRSTEELKRVQQLADKAIAEARRLEAATAQQQADQAAVERLRVQLALSRFPSPFDGIVTAQFAYPGDTIRSGTPVFALADVTRMKVLTKVPETVASRLKSGASAVLELDSTANPGLPAVIANIYPAADPVSHQTAIELDAGEVFPRLQPGHLVKIGLTLAERNQVLTLPNRIVPDARTGGAEQITVIRDGKVEVRSVALGLVLDHAIEVVSGLAEGDAVVLHGGERLKSGDLVKVLGSPTTANGEGGK